MKKKNDEMQKNIDRDDMWSIEVLYNSKPLWDLQRLTNLVSFLFFVVGGSKIYFTQRKIYAIFRPDRTKSSLTCGLND